MQLRRALPLQAVLLCMIAACSSAPDGPEQVTAKKDRAAEYTEFGNEHFSEGNYATALTFFQQALSYNVSVDNEEGMVQSHNSLGKVYIALDRYDDARTSFQAAGEIAESLSDSALIARCSSNLGELFIRQEQYGPARDSLGKALEHMDQAEPTADLAILYHNLGMVAKKSQDAQTAMTYFTKALGINTQLTLYEEMASNHYMIASLHSKAGDYTLARENAALALSYDKQVENSLGIAQDLLALGIISLRASDREGAYGHFQKSYRVYLSLNNAVGTRQLLTYLINTGELLGRDDEVEDYRKLKESLSAE